MGRHRPVRGASVHTGTGWTVVTNFATAPLTLPAGKVVLSSQPLLADGELDGETTARIVTGRG